MRLRYWFDALGCCWYFFSSLVLVHKAVKYCRCVTSLTCKGDTLPMGIPLPMPLPITCSGSQSLRLMCFVCRCNFFSFACLQLKWYHGCLRRVELRRFVTFVLPVPMESDENEAVCLPFYFVFITTTIVCTGYDVVQCVIVDGDGCLLTAHFARFTCQMTILWKWLQNTHTHINYTTYYLL